MQMLEGMRLLEEMSATYALNALWQVPLLCMAAAGAVRLMRRASVVALHRVWVAALLLAVVLPAVPVALGMQARRPVAATVEFTSPRTTIRTSTWTGPSPLADGPVLDFGLVGAPAEKRFNWNAFVLRSIAWLFGAAVVFALAKLGWGLWLAKRLEKDAFEAELCEEAEAVWIECCSRFGVEKAELLQSANLVSPATLSLPNPVVLLPLSLLQADTPPLAAALAHELAHIKRHDFAKNIGYELLGALLFFHPASHWLRRRIAESRELVCDDLAATVLEGRAAYAGNLVWLAESALAGQGVAVGKALGVLEGNVMEKRILNLIETRARQTGWRLAASAVCGVGLLMLSLTVGARFGVRPVFASGKTAVAEVARGLAPAFGEALIGERLRALETAAPTVELEATEVGGELAPLNAAAPVTELLAQEDSDLMTVPFQLGEVSLAGGDKIAITSIRGTTKSIEWENLYEVKGTYTLASAERTTLAINVTTSANANSRKDYGMGPSRIKVEHGSGSFTLWFYMLNNGSPHLSFYPAGGGNSFASVYFESAARISSPSGPVRAEDMQISGAGPALLDGWGLYGDNPSAYRIGAKGQVGHENKSEAFLTSRTTEETPGFGTLMQSFKAENFLGKRVRFRAWVKPQDVKHWAGLWMRVDEKAAGNQKALAFDNIQSRPIKGTSDWTQYDVVLDVPRSATSISMGILLSGPGQVEMSDIKLEVVGEDVAVTEARGEMSDGPANLEMRKSD